MLCVVSTLEKVFISFPTRLTDHVIIVFAVYLQHLLIAIHFWNWRIFCSIRLYAFICCSYLWSTGWLECITSLCGLCWAGKSMNLNHLLWLIANIKGKKNFIINLILVFDESQSQESTIMTKVIRGGVGFNFTRVQLTNNDKKSARVTILMYGIRHVHDIMFCKKFTQ